MKSLHSYNCLAKPLTDFRHSQLGGGALRTACRTWVRVLPLKPLTAFPCGGGGVGGVNIYRYLTELIQLVAWRTAPFWPVTVGSQLPPSPWQYVSCLGKWPIFPSKNWDNKMFRKQTFHRGYKERRIAIYNLTMPYNVLAPRVVKTCLCVVVWLEMFFLLHQHRVGSRSFCQVGLF